MDERPAVAKKSPLSGGQLALVLFWLGGWTWAVLWWFSVNKGYSGWFDDLVTPIAVIGWIVGAVFVGLVAGIARYILSGSTARYVTLVGLPGLAVIWLLFILG